MSETPTVHRSVSQANEYEQCPYRFKLRRIDKAPEIPSVWAPQGTGVHTAAEAFERSQRSLSLEQTQEVFRESYTEAINRQCEQVPNFDHWFRSGPYDAKADIERRFHLGLEQTARYVKYYREIAPEETIWHAPDGTPAIEMEFSIMLGDVLVRGFLDQGVQIPSRGISVRDIKTGKTPGDAFQLAVYAEAMSQVHQVRPDDGDYWMAQRGKPTVPYNLSTWPTERLTGVFQRIDTGIRAGEFPASPDPGKCSRCPVQASCSFFARKVDR